MTAEELVHQCRALDIDLRVQDGRLRYDAPASALTNQLRDLLLRHKIEILALLEPPPAIPSEAEVRAQATCGWELRPRFWERPAAWGGGWVCATGHPAPTRSGLRVIDFGEES